MRRLLIAVFTAAMLGSSYSYAEPVINIKNDKAVKLSNLSPGGECHNAQMKGTVVAVKYDDSEILPENFTIKFSDGSRTLINVDTYEFDNASRHAKGWVGQTLQRWLQKGTKVSLGVKQCGAAGRVLMLDSIQLR